MEKTDLRKELKKFYTAKENPELVDVPEGTFLTYEGRGAPGGPEYMASVNAIYSAAYTLKFGLKKRGSDFAVMPLEGLWWWDDPRIVRLEDAPPREAWKYKSMIRVPRTVTADALEAIKPELAKKKSPTVNNVKLEEFKEGLSVQILHLGPYSDEPRSQKTILEFVATKGLKLRGRHHEVYLSDPSRTAPEKVKTILRHPVE